MLTVSRGARRSGVRRLLAAGGAVLAAAVVTGCGGGEETAGGAAATSSDQSSVAASPGPSDAGDPTEATSPSLSPSASPTPTAEPTPQSYLPVPAGVTLTDQGADLPLGQGATVAWQPRQQLTGVLDLTVDAVRRTSIEQSFSGWQIPTETETSTPYFVRATVTNRGSTDLAGRLVPLYVVNANGTLIEATSFAGEFRPCRRGVFPERFAPGASAKVCLVFFAPEQGGAVSGVTFRPTEDFDPITWTGDVRRLGAGGRGGQGEQ